MKKYLCSMLFSIASFNAGAQIITPAVRSNFGVDGDLRSNFFNGTSMDGTDDWFKNINGSGIQVIDSTGAAAIVRGYQNQPATRNMSFSRLMNMAPFSIVNGNMMLDAVFVRDFHGSDSTVFASGSNKNGMNPADWTCPVSQNIPDKNEILDVFAHVRRSGMTMQDSLWFFGGISIENTNGSRYFDFELSQTDLYYDRALRRFINTGPDAGHTAWRFDSAGNITSPGDIIFSAEFSSSSLTNLEARIWVHQSALNLTPVAFKWGGQFEGASQGASFGYASILPKTAGNFYSGLQSSQENWAGPFALVLKDNSVVEKYAIRQFIEISVNLSKLGLDPAAYSTNMCNSPFRRVLVKTRASNSFTSELKDFVGPIRMFNPPPVDAYADIIYFCDFMPDVQINVLNPVNHAQYSWSTPNGNINGPSNGNSVVINQPGIYYVTQQFHAQCAPESIDSVEILFDTACITLNSPAFIHLSGRKNDNKTELKWKISNNGLRKSFTIEYSKDARNYAAVSNMTALHQEGDVSYSFAHETEKYQTLFYRILSENKNGSYDYSHTIRIHGNEESIRSISAYPNPSRGMAWLSLQAASNEQAVLMIFDSQGKNLSTRTVRLAAGYQTIQLDEVARLQRGIYFIRLISGGDQKNTSLIVQ